MFRGSELLSNQDNFRPETLQQKLTKNSRKFDTNHVILPGFGSFTPSKFLNQDTIRPERQVGVQEAFTLDLRDDLIDIGYEDIITKDVNVKETQKDVTEDISPVLVTVSDADEQLAALKLFDDDIYNDNDDDNR